MFEAVIGIISTIIVSVAFAAFLMQQADENDYYDESAYLDGYTIFRTIIGFFREQCTPNDLPFCMNGIIFCENGKAYVLYRGKKYDVFSDGRWDTDDPMLREAVLDAVTYMREQIRKIS